MRKIASIVLAVAMLLAMSIPAFAASGEGGIRAPRYVAINNIRTTFAISGNKAIGVANVSHSGVKANVKVILQRSTNGGSSYSDYSTMLNKDYTTKTIAAEGSKSGLETKYKYRAKVVVIIYDAGGRQIDTGTAYS